MGLIKRGYGIAKGEGLRTFFSKSAEFVYWNAKESYWKLSSSAVLSIRGFQAEFGTPGRTPHSLCFFEKSERAMLGDILDEITSTDTFWDIGAYIGYYSCFVGQQAEVIAFEPFPIAAEECRENLVRNTIEAPVYEYALAESTGTITLPPGVNTKVDEPVDVESRRGDDIVEELAPPTVVKMDVEGAELEVIDGMETILSSDTCRLLYCEVHKNELSKRMSRTDPKEVVDSVKKKIQAFGFDVEILLERGDELHLKGKKA